MFFFVLVFLIAVNHFLFASTVFLLFNPLFWCSELYTGERDYVVFCLASAWFQFPNYYRILHFCYGFCFECFLHWNLFLLRKLNGSEWTLLNRIENIAAHFSSVIFSSFFRSAGSPTLLWRSSFASCLLLRNELGLSSNVPLILSIHWQMRPLMKNKSIWSDVVFTAIYVFLYFNLYIKFSI